MNETQHIEKKSLRLITGSSPDWQELAKDSVCFANAQGGTIYVGIEDGEDVPRQDQTIQMDIGEKIRKRISELTINVVTSVQIFKADNGGQYIEIKILASQNIASTTDGRYYYRVSDKCNPLPPEDLHRLLQDKPSFTWETHVVPTTNKTDVDPEKVESFVNDIKNSERTSNFLKNKSVDELLDHYLMSSGNYLTNLGVLWLGKRTDRAKLSYAPIVQFLKFDELGNRVNKIVWDDYSLNPKELIEAVWSQIPDWKEGIEVSDGLFRKFIPNYEEEVIRELIANALVHRPYTTRGDIFINLYPDRLEIHNPGLLPMGVTPKNILHKTIRRNNHLAQVFYDLKLMEREGSGYDKIYETLLSNGKQLPVVTEGDDRVTVTISKIISKNEIIKLINRANDEFHLSQKEIICLGLIIQHNSLSALEFYKVLNLPEQSSIKDWMGRLPELDLIKSKGKTKGVEYFINPEFLRRANFKGKTNLKKIETHRLKELILEDLKVYPTSSISEISQRIGNEIPVRKIKLQLDKMVLEQDVITTGAKRWTRYSINVK